MTPRHCGLFAFPHGAEWRCGVCKVVFKFVAAPPKLTTMELETTTVVQLGAYLFVQPAGGSGYYIEQATGLVGIEAEDCDEVRWFLMHEGGSTLVRVEEWGADRLAAAWDQRAA